MKKLFTIDDFAVAFISALGYGFGYSIAQVSGWPAPACLVACLALGILFEEIVSKIAFSKAVQKKPINRIITYVVILLIFLIGQYISIRWLGVSLMEYLSEELVYAVVLPVLGFVVNMLIRGFRERQIRKRYGDGSGGFVFDVSEKDIEETNRQNQAITGEYDAALAVKTRTGIFVGEKYKKTLSFLGVPYAKPPVGALRWQAPEPLPDSEQVFEAKNFGASAIQVEHQGSILKHHRQSEDCLTLNICVSTEKAEKKRPVVVLFHHGGFTCGGTVDPLLYGANYVINHPETVFVSFNYRLGILGFIDFSEVPGGEACPDALNLGLLDQLAALRWIKENIAAFGGDPEKITVLGFEAGAASIFMLAAGGHAKGLFKRAFLFDGNPAAIYTSPAASKALAKRLLEETKTATMQELLALDADTLKAAAQRLWQEMCAPSCDGERFPFDLAQACKEGAASGVEFVIGFPADEMKVYRSSLGEENYAKFIDAALADLRSTLDGPLAQAAEDYLAAQTAASGALEAKSKLIEQVNLLGIYRSAVKLAEGGNKVHLLYWAEKPLLEKLGSGMMDAAATLLGNGEALQMYGSVLNKDLSETLQTLLQKFIAGESLQLYPNEIHGVDALSWKAYPKALIVEDGKLTCGKIDDRLTQIQGLLDFAVQ